MNYYKISTGVSTTYLMCESVSTIDEHKTIAENIKKHAEIRISRNEHEHEAHGSVKMLEFKSNRIHKIQVIELTQEQFDNAYNAIEAFELAKAKINQQFFVDSYEL